MWESGPPSYRGSSRLRLTQDFVIRRWPNISFYIFSLVKWFKSIFQPDILPKFDNPFLSSPILYALMASDDDKREANYCAAVLVWQD